MVSARLLIFHSQRHLARLNLISLRDYPCIVQKGSDLISCSRLAR